MQLNTRSLYPSFSKREGEVWHLKEKEGLTFTEIQKKLNIGRSVEEYHRRAKQKLTDMEITLKNAKGGKGDSSPA